MLLSSRMREGCDRAESVGRVPASEKVVGMPAGVAFSSGALKDEEFWGSVKVGEDLGWEALGFFQGLRESLCQGCLNESGARQGWGGGQREGLVDQVKEFEILFWAQEEAGGLGQERKTHDQLYISSALVIGRECRGGWPKSH